MVIAPPGRRFDYENSCAATRRRFIGELTVAFGTAFHIVSPIRGIGRSLARETNMRVGAAHRCAPCLAGRETRLVVSSGFC